MKYLKGLSRQGLESAAPGETSVKEDNGLVSAIHPDVSLQLNLHEHLPWTVIPHEVFCPVLSFRYCI